MFRIATPVWAKGKEKEMNTRVILRAKLSDLTDCVLSIAAFSFYRLTVNGKFAFFGPARTAEGFARVDRLDLGNFADGSGSYALEIEVAGYYCKTLSTCIQPSFVCCEVTRGDTVLLATGRDFEGFLSARHVRKVERYSAQRHFGEVTDERNAGGDVPCELVPVDVGVRFLPRRVPAPAFREIPLGGCAKHGTFVYDETLPCLNNRYSGTLTADRGKFEEAEIPHLPFRWVQKQALTRTGENAPLPLELRAGEYAVFDFEKIEVGFLEWCFRAAEESDVVIAFAEMCFDNDFEFANINAQTVIETFLPAGREVNGNSFEPYSFRFAVVMVKSGSLTVSGFGMRTYERSREGMIPRKLRDPELQSIYDAAERTFLHNAVDLFTDCPSRERAGWLCDSYFTARAEHFFYGKTPIEDAFLENYRLFERDPANILPAGALPMCYPSDVKRLGGHAKDESFIPQWNLWYVLEVSEYLTERNPSADRESFRKSVYGILDFFARYENADGLLQQLPAWNFVEWSTANEWTWDVNYPTNFLYSAALEAAGNLYGDAALTEKAGRVRATTRKMAYDGEYFVDHAVFGEDGKLHNLTDTSEAGQYYAVLFGGVNPDDPEYARLKAHIAANYRDREDDGRTFVPVNAFIGLYLRIIMLMRRGEKALLRRDLKEFFSGMVAATGTLWEYKQHKGSYDHGFASLAGMAAVFADEE